MADKKRPRRTRERILETALALFNLHGEPSVTTAHIADEMNISPGNLYYHFRNKDEIIGELYAAYEAGVGPLFAAPPDRAPGVEDLWLLLHLL
jgi:AcrR family transcriptional regulator